MKLMPSSPPHIRSPGQQMPRWMFYVICALGSLLILWGPSSTACALWFWGFFRWSPAWRPTCSAPGWQGGKSACGIIPA